ncbi:MAG TPA: cation-transporting P-type ATPase, partial [Patescibacteria group bacterium]|nr:cation-transporting P-type ATPase [Patescibacteria group bacterium]
MSPDTSSLGSVRLVDAARLPAAEALARLGSSTEGLTSDEAARRLAEFGANAVRTHDVHAPAILGRQLRNPLLILLGAATLTSFIVGEHTDAIIILTIVGLSVGLGFFNEYRSERVIEALHSRIRHRSLALRDGKPIAVDVTELVPGDVVQLRTGDLIPADLRLINVRELECDQAVLTGESSPKSKSIDAETDLDAGELGLRCAAYMGTTVRGGSGAGVVVATAGATAFGKIAVRLGER